MSHLFDCTKCPRIVKNFEQLKLSHPDLINKPIAPKLNTNSFLCIVGLAPGLLGANRTGKIFDGDFSGDILKSALETTKYFQDDINTYPHITNAIKCLPPFNKPIASEINNCNVYLKHELNSISNLRVIIALGSIAHRSVLKVYEKNQVKYQFAHGAIHKINNNIILIDSYHCSKININTKRLSISMLEDILELAKLYQ
tara:strand:- start:561 stop:1157 length:597 start_codon:yes stop_codon:yes gene_type:complete